MCGRFTLRTPAAQLIELFHVSYIPMRWGLIPFWAKDMAIGNQMINARSETVAEKPAFRSAFKKQRCIVVADGFFEWQKLSTGKKQPWLIEQADHQPFAMAGLWECWTPKPSPDQSSVDSISTDPVISCTILTTAANEDMSPLHDRMPVILPIEAWATWLSPKANADQVGKLLQPLPNGQLFRTSVSTVVNRPIVDNVECIKPVESPEPL